MPNVFCYFLPSDLSVFELPWPHVIVLFSCNNSLLCYVKLFTFEFIVDLHVTYKEKLIVRYVTQESNIKSDITEFYVNKNLKNIFPNLYIYNGCKKEMHYYL